MFRKTSKILKAAMLTGMTLASGGSVFQSCGGDLGGYGGYNPYYADYEQSVDSYRQDVYDSVNAGWDDYIRE